MKGLLIEFIDSFSTDYELKVKGMYYHHNLSYVRASTYPATNPSTTQKNGSMLQSKFPGQKMVEHLNLPTVSPITSANSIKTPS